MKSYIKWLFLPVLGIILLYITASLLFSIIPVRAEKTSSPRTIEIYVMGNGVHTDIVLPVQTDHINWKEIFREDDFEVNSSFQYVAIGWGNKDFYINTPTWADLTFKTAVKAASGMGEAAFHITWYRQVYEGERCHKLILTEEQFDRLINYILSYLPVDTDDRALPVYANIYYGKYDRFYEAKGHYNIFFTCNTWVNVALKRCGQRTALWTPLEQSILYHAKK